MAGNVNYANSVEELISIMTGGKASVVKSGDPKEFQTLAELAADAGKSRDWVTDRIRILSAKGLIELGKKQELDPIEGRVKTVLAYKFILPKKEK